MEFIGVTKRILRAAGLNRPARAMIETYARLRPKQICVREGITYELDLAEVIDRAIWMGGWEPETIRFLRRNIRQDDVVIEVGANIGAHSLILADLVGPAGRVHAFEPTDYAQTKLRTNLAHNPVLAPRITVRSDLVTNHEHATPLRTIKSSFSVGDQTRSVESVSAPAMALDSLELSRLDVIKIDVDGYDYKVLQGATRLIKQFKPLIFIELCEYTLNAQRDSIRDIFKLMSDLGYIASYEDGRAIRNTEEILALVGHHTSINGVFRAQLVTPTPIVSC
jgi:FkbM family methyltransferase